MAVESGKVAQYDIWHISEETKMCCLSVKSASAPWSCSLVYDE